MTDTTSDTAPGTSSGSTSAPLPHVRLKDRGFLKITGEDRGSFLQGLISNDIEKVWKKCVIHAALLTPQGKYLHDFFIAEEDDGYLLECERDRLADLLRRLKLYKLRAKCALEDVSETFEAVVFPGAAPGDLGLEDTAGAAGGNAGGVLYMDPRLKDLGARAMLPTGEADPILADLGAREVPRDGYDQLRLSLGVPDGSRDLIVEKSILLESGFDELNGVDWNKGCYMGQELTARTKYRGLIKKRLMPVTIEGPAPEPGTPVLAGDVEAGEMRSAAGDKGLALLRLERIEGLPGLTAGDAKLTARKPDWAEF